MTVATRPADAATATPEKSDLATRILMATGGITSALLSMGLLAVLPQIEAALAHSPDDKLLVKMLVTIGGVTMVLGAPLGGFLSDRIGLRPVLVAASFLYAISGTAGLYVDSLYALLGSRLLLGLSAATITTLAMTLINTRLEGNDRARWMGIHVSVALVGAIVLHPVVGWLGAQSWRWPFVIYGLGLLLALLALGIRSTGATRARTPVARAEARAQQAAGPAGWFPFFYLALALAIGMTTFTLSVYVPFIARGVGVTSPFSIALLMLADSIVAAITAILFGRARTRISAHAAFVISFGCAGVGTAVTALAPDFMIVVAGMLLFGLGQAWFVPNLMTAWAPRVSAAQQGRAVGFIKAAFYLGAPLGTLLVEPVSRRFGPSGAVGALAAIDLAVFALFVVRWATARGGTAGIGVPSPALAD